MTIEVRISDRLVFKSKKAAAEHYREILHSYQNGDTISNNDHVRDLKDLILYRDKNILDGAPKRGDEVDHFEKRVNEKSFSTSSFWIVRKDGTETDFSYIQAVEGSGRKVSQEFYRACYQAVLEDSSQLKKKIFEKFSINGLIKSEITGKMISLEEAKLKLSRPKFIDIVEEFNEINNCTSKIKDIITAPADDQMLTKFKDKSVEAKFRKFFKEKARMYIIEEDKKYSKKIVEKPQRIYTFSEFDN